MQHGPFGDERSGVVGPNQGGFQLAPLWIGFAVIVGPGLEAGDKAMSAGGWRGPRGKQRRECCRGPALGDRRLPVELQPVLGDANLRDRGRHGAAADLIMQPFLDLILLVKAGARVGGLGKEIGDGVGATSSSEIK